jgi:hypothetical protein
LFGAAVLMLFVLAALVITPFNHFFGLSAISGVHWLIVIGLSIVPTIMCEIFRLFDNIPSVIKYRQSVGAFLTKNFDHLKSVFITKIFGKKQSVHT